MISPSNSSAVLRCLNRRHFTSIPHSTFVPLRTCTSCGAIPQGHYEENDLTCWYTLAVDDNLYRYYYQSLRSFSLSLSSLYQNHDSRSNSRPSSHLSSPKIVFSPPSVFFEETVIGGNLDDPLFENHFGCTLNPFRLLLLCPRAKKAPDRTVERRKGGEEDAVTKWGKKSISRRLLYWHR